VDPVAAAVRGAAAAAAPAAAAAIPDGSQRVLGLAGG
jgi:hypothetical protein